jgi:spore coat protein U-like protein
VLFPSDSRFLVGGLALALVALPGSAALAQDTATLNVSATVAAECELSGGSLNFGTYSAGEASEADTDFSYTCSEGADITVTLDGGGHEQQGSRAMSGDGGTLTYELYQDAGLSDPWGIGTDGLEVDDTVGGQTSVPVYGRIPSGQQVPPGEYSDTVQITLNVN